MSWPDGCRCFIPLFVKKSWAHFQILNFLNLEKFENVLLLLSLCAFLNRGGAHCVLRDY